MEILEVEGVFFTPTRTSGSTYRRFNIPHGTEEDVNVGFTFIVGELSSALVPIFNLKNKGRKNILGLYVGSSGDYVTIDSGISQRLGVKLKSGDSYELRIIDTGTHIICRLVTRSQQPANDGTDTAVVEKSIPAGDYYVTFGGGFNESALQDWVFEDLKIFTSPSEYEDIDDDDLAPAEVVQTVEPPLQQEVTIDFSQINLHDFVMMNIKMALQVSAMAMQVNALFNSYMGNKNE